MNKTKSCLSIFFNALLIIAVSICLGSMATRTLHYKDAEPIILHWRIFLYFNVLASIVLALSCVVMLGASAMNISKNRPNLGYLKHAYIFKLIGTTSAAFVLLTCILVVGPTKGFDKSIFEDEQWALNIAIPIVATLSFVFLEYKKTKKVSILFAVIPALVYIVICIPLNLTGTFDKAIHDQAPYPIFDYQNAPAWESTLETLALVAVSFGTGAGIYFANRAMFENAYPRINAKKYQKEQAQKKNIKS